MAVPSRRRHEPPFDGGRRRWRRPATPGAANAAPDFPDSGRSAPSARKIRPTRHRTPASRKTTGQTRGRKVLRARPDGYEKPAGAIGLDSRPANPKNARIRGTQQHQEYTLTKPSTCLTKQDHLILQESLRSNRPQKVTGRPYAKALFSSDLDKQPLVGLQDFAYSSVGHRVDPSRVS